MTRPSITPREARMRFPGEVTPRQARRKASAIREEFLRELAAALDRDVLFVERPRLIAWLSAQGRVEHARLEPYSPTTCLTDEIRRGPSSCAPPSTTADRPAGSRS